MVFLLTLLTSGYFAVVAWSWHSRRTAGPTAATAAPLAVLPADDLPPPTAVGWPPGGTGFPSYVAEGFAALDAYLSEGYAA
jgi:hypothetical protein